MITGSSLQAFSGATTTSPISRAQSSDAVRLVRTDNTAAVRQASPALPALPTGRPGVPPPRGSLLNLSA